MNDIHNAFSKFEPIRKPDWVQHLNRRATDRPKDYERSMQIIGLAVVTMLVVIGAGWLKAFL